jgi:hypothetical protein
VNLPKRVNRSRQVKGSGRVTRPIAPIQYGTDIKNYDALCQSLRDAVQHSLLDLYESPELEEVRQAWVAAYKAEDSAALKDVISDAQRIAREAKKKNRRE